MIATVTIVKIHVYYKKCRLLFSASNLFGKPHIIGDMSSSHQSTIMSLEQAKIKYRNLVTIYLTYVPISQNVSEKESWKRSRPWLLSRKILVIIILMAYFILD